MSLPEHLETQIKGLVTENRVMLFMKGTRQFPQCGFSASVIALLDEYLPDYETFNVLADQEVREGIKVFSDWPTIPQLYVDQEFVGGADIVRELHDTGELASVLGAKPIDVEPPQVTLTETAVAAFTDAKAQEDEFEDLRLEISPRFQYALSFGPKLDGDIVVESNGFELRMDRSTARRAGGMTIDFVDGPQGAGFKIDNPNEPPKVQQLDVQGLKTMLDDDAVKLFDVRPGSERAIAAHPNAVAMDDGGLEMLEALDRETPIAFLCRTGSRSQGAAQHFLGQGFKTVYNVAGGIHAWADAFDPSLPKY